MMSIRSNPLSDTSFTPNYWRTVSSPVGRYEAMHWKDKR